jgi:predicted MFS family arabinose efflux permease
MPRPVRGSASYRAVLALPRARLLFCAALLARLCYALLGLPLLLALRGATGSYGVAGTAAGLFGLGGALLGPARARLVERRPAALPGLALSYAALLLALAAACALPAAPALTCGLAVTAGLLPPPVGPLMRTVWARLAGEGRQRQAALSLDTAAESTVFAAGPALGGLLVAMCGAPAALACCAIVVLLGFGLLTAALRDRPARPGAGPAAPGARGPLRGTGFAPLLVPVLGAAAALALAEIAAVAAWGTPAAGVLTTLASVGGVLGGLLYGRSRPPGSLERRPLALGFGCALCYALPAAAYGLPGAGAGLLAAGACESVLLITMYELVAQLFAEGPSMAAGAWVNTAYNLGAALGTPLGGLLLDRSGPRPALAAAAAVAGACTAVGAGVRARALRAGVVPARGAAAKG